MDRNPVFADRQAVRDHQVALRKESVDRNRRREDGSLRLDTVALRKESVDRNDCAHGAAHCALVALRKESVDRNIGGVCNMQAIFYVALRKESVDRNALVPAARWQPARRSPQGERG